MQIKTVKRKETEEVLNKHLGMMQKLMTEMKMEMEMNVNPQGKTKKDSSKKRRGIADENSNNSKKTKNYVVRTRSYNKWQANTYTCGRSLKNRGWHCPIHITTYK